MSRQARRRAERVRRQPPAASAKPTTLEPAATTFAAMTTTRYPSGIHRRRVFLSLEAAQREKERASGVGAVVSVDLVQLVPLSGAAQREAALSALTAVAS